jgi:hypothetical protein
LELGVLWGERHFVLAAGSADYDCSPRRTMRQTPGRIFRIVLVTYGSMAQLIFARLLSRS